MPCYDSRSTYEYGVEETENKLNPKINLLEDRIRALNGALCAIANELDRRGIVYEVFQDASRKGLINLMDWLRQHKGTDEARLADDIHQRYSVDELETIKRILGN